MSSGCGLICKQVFSFFLASKFLTPSPEVSLVSTRWPVNLSGKFWKKEQKKKTWTMPLLCSIWFFFFHLYPENLYIITHISYCIISYYCSQGSSCLHFRHVVHPLIFCRCFRLLLFLLFLNFSNQKLASSRRPRPSRRKSSFGVWTRGWKRTFGPIISPISGPPTYNFPSVSTRACNLHAIKKKRRRKKKKRSRSCNSAAPQTIKEKSEGWSLIQTMWREFHISS